MNETTCFVCIEEFNKSNKKKIECNLCAYKCCIECNQSYLIEKEELHCMNCKHIWDDSYLTEQFTKAFTKLWKEHLKDIELNKEKFKLDEYARLFNNEKKKRMYEKKIKEVKETTKRNMIKLKENKRKIIELEKSLNIQKETHIRNLKRCITRLDNEEVVMNTNVIKCSDNNCNGFYHKDISDNIISCVICHNQKCSSCYEKYHHEHVCNDDTIKSIKMIESETKKCPRCNINISKIDGCDQMWCVQCKTTFSWNTGNIINVLNIHNPHYIEYMRQKYNLTRDIRDIPCGGLPTRYQLLYLLRDNNITVKITDKMGLIIDMILEINDEMIQQLVDELNSDKQKKKIAFDYLNQTITEKQWRDMIVSNNEKKKKLNDTLNLLHMFTLVCADILQRLMNTERKDLCNELLNNYIFEFNSIREYLNEIFFKLHIKYSTRSIINITDLWVFKKSIPKKEGKINNVEVVNSLFEPPNKSIFSSSSASDSATSSATSSTTSSATSSTTSSATSSKWILSLPVFSSPQSVPQTFSFQTSSEPRLPSESLLHFSFPKSYLDNN